MLILEEHCWQAHQHNPRLQVLDHSRAAIFYSVVSIATSLFSRAGQLAIVSVGEAKAPQIAMAGG